MDPQLPTQLTSTFLQDFKIENAPSSIYYIPNFITAEEEEILLQNVGHQRTLW